MVTLYISELSYPPMTTIAILAVLAILTGVTLLITGFTVISSVDAQVTGDNATMSGNMTGGNATGGNMSGSISSVDDGESGGGSVTTNDGGGGCLDC
jgi:xanthosine utilization system XapX-like protein